MRLARRTVLLAAAGLPLGCRRAAAAAPAGWQAARWNMNGAALDAAFHGTIRRLQPPLAFGPWIADRAVDGARIGGRRFLAFLQHPPGQDRLRQVLLRFAGGQPTPADFAAVKQALVAELGRPGQGDVDTNYSGSFPSLDARLRWRFPATTVTLRYVDPDAEPYSGVRKSLTVRYTAER